MWRFGTPDQHERFLVPAIRGEKIAALGITEPGAGSDVASIRTTARACPGSDEPDVLAELDRAARDARLGPIGGGTDEIMKEILSKGLGCSRTPVALSGAELRGRSPDRRRFPPGTDLCAI